MYLTAMAATVCTSFQIIDSKKLPIPSQQLSTQKLAKATLKKMPMKLREEEQGIRKTYRAEELNILCKNGQVKETLSVLNHLEQQGLKADCYKNAQILNGCMHLKALLEGKITHARIMKAGFESDSYIGNCLLNMYAKCRSVTDARLIFDQMPQRNVVAWTAMLSGYAQNGHAEEALEIFREMQLVNMELDSYIFGSVIKACSSIEDIQVGQQVHARAIKTGWEPDVCVGNALVDMYCKHGRVLDARNLLDGIRQQDVISWTAMISGYAKSGNPEEAVRLFSEMQLAGMQPNQFTFTCVLGICSNLLDLQKGKQVHAHVIKLGFETEDYVRIGIVDLYAKCGSMVNACKIFSKISKPDVVICTAMIGGYARNGQGEQALKLFCCMRRLGRKPNEFTFTNILTACSSIAARDYGKQVHGLIIQTGFESVVHVGGALVDMYAKCGCVSDAHDVFDKLAKPSSISCSAMIAGYALNGHPQKALKLFCTLQREGTKPNEFIFTSVLSACGSIANLSQGSQVHLQIIKTGFQSDVCVGGALVDMYANCGNLLDAHKVFDEMHEKDTISWTAMIAGYAQHGNGKEALKLFEQMQEAGITPNHVTFVSVLSACSHAGLVDEGFWYFDSMVQDYGISPILHHYACIVDLLGRAGRLDEAEDFIRKMHCKPTALIWRTLLGASTIHGDMNIGMRAAEQILELDPKDDSTYVLLSNMCTAAGRQDKALEVRNLMKYRGVQKEPGLSWIQVGNIVHSFASKDTSHPKAKEIYAKLEDLTCQIKEAGYIPQTSLLLQDWGEQR